MSRPPMHTGGGFGRPGPMKNTDKPRNMREAWSKLFRYLGRYRPYIVLSVILSVLGTVLTLIGPNMLGEITDIIETGISNDNIDLDKVWAIGLFLIAIYSASAIFTFLENYVLSTVSQMTARNLRSDFSSKINRIPLKFLDNKSSGDIISCVTNDIDTIGQSMNVSIETSVAAITLLIGSTVMMLYTNLTMTATAMMSTIVGFALMSLIISRSQKYFVRQQENLGAMDGHVEELYSAHNVVKAYNGERKAKQHFDEINRELFRSSFRAQFMSGLMMPLMNFIGNLGYVAVCIVGAVLVINGDITFGVIVAFIVYVRLFTQPLTQLAQAFTNMQSVAAASERVFRFIDEEEQEDDSNSDIELQDIKGDVEFRNVCFGYVPNKEVIHNFSAKICAGQKIAIVGPTGAGKTTIVNLLMRFYDIDRGDILIDGTSIKKVTRNNLRDQFCMVLQDTWIFSGSIRENIVYCEPDIKDEQIISVCKTVGIHHFIMTLPEGYDTILNDETELSMGQRQQITIARAMIRQSPLLIMDEATSSVDTRTEKMIQDAMDRLMEGRTSFVIAHRLSTIRNSDLILVMRDGCIVEKGDHETLLAENGFYKELYMSQFEDAGTV